MKLLEWLSTQLDILQCELLEIEEDTNVQEIILHISNDKNITPVKSTPAPIGKRGHHSHDNYELHPVATKHPILVQEPPLSTVPSMYANNPDYIMDCDAPKCDNGKYLLVNGTYSICYRCDGKGWINKNKHDRNLAYDKKRS